MVKENKQQVIIRICCVIAAFILWLYTSNEDVNKVHRITNIPIQIINEDNLKQSGLILSPNQEFTISLKISGKPTDIYAVKADQFKLVADLSIYALKKGENKIPVNIVKRPNNNISIINDGSMWITIKVDNYDKKTLPINAKVKGQSKNGFFYKKLIINPKNVTVSGARQYIDTVYEIIAEVDLNNPQKDITAISRLKALDKNGLEIKEVDIQPKNAKIIIPVQKSKEVRINIKTKGNLPKGVILKNIKLSKDKVIITGDLKELDKIDSIETEPINLNDLREEKSKVNLKLVLPSKVKIVDSKDYVEGEISVDKVAQKNLKCNIDIVNLGRNFSAKLDKENISVIVSGGNTSINGLNDKNIKCCVDLESLTKGEYSVPVKLQLPQGINIISQSSKFIKVIITEDNDITTNENGSQNKNEQDKNDNLQEVNAKHR